MILTVTPNPAYDITYTVPRVEPGAVHRVADVRERAGGKGVNVARVLMRLAEPVRALGFGNDSFAADLEAIGLRNDLVPTLRRVRRTVVVQGADATTSFWEPGPALTQPDASDLLVDRLRAHLPEARGVVISGSLPEGADPALPARLAEAALDAGMPVVVDTDGEPLRIAARVPGVVLVPNVDELAQLVPGSDSEAEVLDACDGLVASGARAVIATRGERGTVAVTRDGSWRATPEHRVDGNPTGAGDAAAAAIIAGLASAMEWPALLSDAVATSAAAVAVPVAGEIEESVRERMRVRIDELAVQRGGMS